MVRPFSDDLAEQLRTAYRDTLPLLILVSQPDV